MHVTLASSSYLSSGLAATLSEGGEELIVGYPLQR